ncbi:MAG: hypothetical protein LWX56_05360 [Ignavibacteria bacterium]|nr:hypothetical protein [Ignavibacteria bacterium]
MVVTATQTVDYYTQYYCQCMAENNALSGINIANSAIAFTPNWRDGVPTTSVAGGTMQVLVTNDTLYTTTFVKFTGIGTFNGYTDTIVVRLKMNNYAKYGSFNAASSAYFATGDTIDGPCHAVTSLPVTGSPVFLGRVTCKSGINKSPSSSTPQLLGGYASGIDIAFTPNIGSTASLAKLNGYVFRANNVSKPYVNVDMTFNADATVTYKTQISADGTTWSGWSATTTSAISTLAPNGVIAAYRGNFIIRGQLDGRCTLCALVDSTGNATGGIGAGAKFGNIFVDNSITYVDDPRTVTTSTDQLGLICENRLEVTFNNSRGNIAIQGSILCKNDGLTINSYASYSGIWNMNLLGGVAQKNLYPTTNSGLTAGYRYVQKYDQRLLTTVPPGYPDANNYTIYSWLQ